MAQVYYLNTIAGFLKEESYSIFGKLTANHPFSLEDRQRTAWLSEIEILKRELNSFKSNEDYIGFEYTIPRIGKRVDIIIIINGLVFVIECKIGDKVYSCAAIEQVTDYSLDLKDFHEESRYTLLIPILLASEAPAYEINFEFIKKEITNVQKCNQNSLNTILKKINRKIYWKYYSSS